MAALSAQERVTAAKRDDRLPVPTLEREVPRTVSTGRGVDNTEPTYAHHAFVRFVAGSHQMRCVGAPLGRSRLKNQSRPQADPSRAVQTGG